MQSETRAETAILSLGREKCMLVPTSKAIAARNTNGKTKRSGRRRRRNRSEARDTNATPSALIADILHETLKTRKTRVPTIQAKASAAKSTATVTTGS